MKLDDFQNSPSGHLTPTENSQLAFVPNLLPPEGVNLEAIIYRLANASALLGQLSGVGKRFTNPDLLARPLQRKEAVASSSIEGTHTTLSDLFVMEARDDDKDSPPDTKEVHNYVMALEHAIRRLDELPISTRLIKEIHILLLDGLPRIRGGEIPPGEFKRSQNYIGGSSLETARFIPAPHFEVERLMGDLENFIHSSVDNKVPPLILAALAHYQFETIHPFGDGNGRVGRLLIPLILKEQRLLDAPLLYLSPYFEQNKDEYIDKLYCVSKTGDWLGWLDYFLGAVEETSSKTIATVQTLHDLNINYLDIVQKAKSSLLLRGLINSCFEFPMMTIPEAARILGVTYHSAQNNIEKLIEAGILAELNDGKRPKLFVADEIYQIINNQ